MQKHWKQTFLTISILSLLEKAHGKKNITNKESVALESILKYTAIIVH